MDQGKSQRKSRSRRIPRSSYLRQTHHRYPQTRQTHLNLNPYRKIQNRRLNCQNPSQKMCWEWINQIRGRSQQTDFVHPCAGSWEGCPSCGWDQGGYQEGKTSKEMMLFGFKYQFLVFLNGKEDFRLVFYERADKCKEQIMTTCRRKKNDPRLWYRHSSILSITFAVSNDVK